MGIKIYVIMAICSPAFSVKWIGKKLDKFEVRICLKKYITSSIDDDYVRRVVEWTELVVIILFETGQEWLAGWRGAVAGGDITVQSFRRICSRAWYSSPSTLPLSRYMSLISDFLTRFVNEKAMSPSPLIARFAMPSMSLRVKESAASSASSSANNTPKLYRYWYMLCSLRR